MLTALAWLAIVPYILGAFMKTPRLALACFLCGNAMYITYYALTGVNAPAINLAAVSCITFMIIFVSSRHLLMLVFLGFALTAIPILSNMQSWMDITLVIAAGTNFFAQYNRENLLRFRSATLCSQTLWICFTIHTNDTPMLLCTLFFASALIISIIRQMVLKPIVPDPTPL